MKAIVIDPVKREVKGIEIELLLVAKYAVDRLHDLPGDMAQGDLLMLLHGLAVTLVAVRSAVTGS